jgi:hypothetical protein
VAADARARVALRHARLLLGHGLERALGEAIRGRRNDVFLATKFCQAEDI